MECPDCGSDIPEDAAACPFCEAASDAEINEPEELMEWARERAGGVNDKMKSYAKAYLRLNPAKAEVLRPLINARATQAKDQAWVYIAKAILGDALASMVPPDKTVGEVFSDEILDLLWLGAQTRAKEVLEQGPLPEKQEDQPDDDSATA